MTDIPMTTRRNILVGLAALPLAGSAVASPGEAVAAVEPPAYHPDDITLLREIEAAEALLARMKASLEKAAEGSDAMRMAHHFEARCALQAVRYTVDFVGIASDGLFARLAPGHGSWIKGPALERLQELHGGATWLKRTASELYRVGGPAAEWPARRATLATRLQEQAANLLVAADRLEEALPTSQDPIGGASGPTPTDCPAA